MANSDDSTYYRHYKGHYYKFLHLAKHSETGEELVVYKALYEDGKVWVRPKEMFFGTVETEDGTIRRFQPVDPAEIERDVRKSLRPKYCFPDIDYSDELIPLQDSDSIGFSKPVKVMSQTLANKGIFVLKDYTDAGNDDELEKAINEKIAAYKDSEEERQTIFNMIEIWGGSAGRMLYLKDRFDWNDIMPKYRNLVNVCLDVKNISDETLDAVVNAVTECEQVQNFGVAFITKHSRYWLQKSLKDDALPIFDSVMARNVMRMKDPNTARLKEYWEVMMDKSNLESISLVNLERQLFKYFYKR